MMKKHFYYNGAVIENILSIELIFLDVHCVITRTGSSDNLNNAR